MTGKEGKPTRIDARAQGDKHHDTIETCRLDGYLRLRVFEQRGHVCHGLIRVDSEYVPSRQRASHA